MASVWGPMWGFSAPKVAFWRFFVLFPQICSLGGLIEKAVQCQRRGLAGGLGFEPRQAESESAVLPLDDPPTEAKA